MATHGTNLENARKICASGLNWGNFCPIVHPLADAPGKPINETLVWKKCVGSIIWTSTWALLKGRETAENPPAIVIFKGMEEIPGSNEFRVFRKGYEPVEQDRVIVYRAHSYPTWGKERGFISPKQVAGLITLSPQDFSENREEAAKWRLKSKNRNTEYERNLSEQMKLDFETTRRNVSRLVFKTLEAIEKILLGPQDQIFEMPD